MVWGGAVLGYTITVMNRGSFGVAGSEATAHFGASPGILSTFAMLQLATYASAQIPIGLLLDRFGSRIMITCGLVLMAAGQAWLGMVDSVPLALAARVLLGVGDACILNSVLRLMPRWFVPQRVPLMNQITAMIGALGQVATVLFALPLIQTKGWQLGLLALAGISLVGALTAVALIRNAPAGQPPAVIPERFRDMPKRLRELAAHPATQLGWWVHFTTGFSANAFLFMWGMPYLRYAQEISQAEASLLLALMPIVSLAVGPMIGVLTAKHPLRRSTLALLTVIALMGCWGAVLVLPSRAPMPLLVLLILALAVTGPASGIGFDFPRTSIPVTRLGTAIGVVNTGSFVGSAVLVIAMGALMDWLSGGSTRYTFTQWRMAWLLQVPFFAVGISGILITRRSLRKLMAQDGVAVPSWRQVIQRLRHH